MSDIKSSNAVPVAPATEPEPLKPGQIRISLGLLPMRRNHGESIRDAALRNILIRPARATPHVSGEPSPNVWYDKPTLRLDRYAAQAIKRADRNYHKE
jgi:hypothetical protein